MGSGSRSAGEGPVEIRRNRIKIPSRPLAVGWPQRGTLVQGEERATGGFSEGGLASPPPERAGRLSHQETGLGDSLRLYRGGGPEPLDQGVDRRTPRCQVLKRCRQAMAKGVIDKSHRPLGTEWIAVRILSPRQPAVQLVLVQPGPGSGEAARVGERLTCRRLLHRPQGSGGARNDRAKSWRLPAKIL
jgi:hypothetical protein